jgi:hypothetical protein
MAINTERGKMKPMQAAKLLRLATDKKASRKDRAWAKRLFDWNLPALGELSLVGHKRT